MRRLTLVVVALLVVACGPQAGSAAIDLDLYEFGITSSSEVYEPGTVELAVTNSGEFGHTVLVTSESGEILLASDIIPPGESVDLTVELDDGSYQISCRIVTAGDDGTVFDHYERGMITTISEGA